jgi:hypothetical protein
MSIRSKVQSQYNKIRSTKRNGMEVINENFSELEDGNPD